MVWQLNIIVLSNSPKFSVGGRKSVRTNLGSFKLTWYELIWSKVHN